MCKELKDWMEAEMLVGMERGIEAFVQDKIEDGKQEDEIVSRLVLRFHLDEGKARDYYQKYRMKRAELKTK